MPETSSIPNVLCVIVSGGSRGLGLGIVRSLLDKGHHVATFSRNATEEVRQLRTNPDCSDRFEYKPVDASNTADLRMFVKDCHQKWGRVDALINNAGVAYDNVLAMTPDDEIQRMIDVNLKASLLLAKECSRLMLAQNSGNIINIASIIADRGFRGLSAYAATKAGMIGMTRSLAREMGPRGIRVNAVAPGYLETEMSGSLGEDQRSQIERRTPLGRLGTVEDVVPVINFLLSPASGFVTGQVITVDGGSSI